MKLFFVADIHGSSFYLKKALEKYKEEQADSLVLLGDFLYHGPRNSLPEGYNPKEVAECLNGYADQIVGIRGNCDSEVDQMLLQFPMMADYMVLFYNNRRIFASHGHIYHAEHLPSLRKGDIFIQGHTHIPVADKVNDIYILNPGSIALPKGGFANSYGIMEQDTFTIKDFEGGVIKSITL